jgi:Multiple myeloma tumor-associated
MLTFPLQSVKNDKDREFYLGHSVKASTGRHVHYRMLFSGLRLVLAWALNITIRSDVGVAGKGLSGWILGRRWQKNKDILWYTRQKGADEAQQRADELVAIKAREEDLMAEVGAVHSCRGVHSPNHESARVIGCGGMVWPLLRFQGLLRNALRNSASHAVRNFSFLDSIHVQRRRWV